MLIAIFYYFVYFFHFASFKKWTPPNKFHVFQQLGKVGINLQASTQKPLIICRKMKEQIILTGKPRELTKKNKAPQEEEPKCFACRSQSKAHKSWSHNQWSRIWPYGYIIPKDRTWSTSSDRRRGTSSAKDNFPRWKMKKKMKKLFGPDLKQALASTMPWNWIFYCISILYLKYNFKFFFYASQKFSNNIKYVYSNVAMKTLYCVITSTN